MHMGNVEWLVLCLQLWLATSYSKIITKPMDNVVSCEGGTGVFPWTDDTEHLYIVEYFFQNKIIAKSSSPNFSSVEYKDEDLKSRLLKDDNVAFRIENVTEKDRGEYKIVLTDAYGDELELVGSLDVTVPGSGTLNITQQTNNPNVFRCGEKTGSDQYTWVFTKAGNVTKRNTKESELTLDDLPQNGSLYCVRLSDCQRSPYFSFTSGIEHGDCNIIVTNTTEDCRTLKCGEPVGTNPTYEWSIRVEGEVEYRNRTTTNTFKLCRKNFDCSVMCQRDNDCTETWMCFTPGETGRRRRKRTLDDQLVPCENLDDSSPNTTGIAVAVVSAGIAGIAILTVVTLRKLRSRAGRRSDSFKVEAPASTECHELVDKTYQPEEKSDGELEELKDSKDLQDKETCEQVNLNQTT